jgi:hypothetical protein
MHVNVVARHGLITMNSHAETRANAHLSLSCSLLVRHRARPLLRIVEQPPEKSVYKRNLKPNPTLQLVEEELGMESNLYIAPVLIRCDTLEEKNKLLTGNKPVKVRAPLQLAGNSSLVMKRSTLTSPPSPHFANAAGRARARCFIPKAQDHGHLAPTGRVALCH